MEIVFNSHTYEALLADAERLGFTYTDEAGDKHIITNGSFETGGSWFLNVVGDVYDPITGPVDPDNPPTPVKRDGYFGRLRLNGTPDNMPTFSSAITQYVYRPGDMDQPGKWVDAATGADAPDWIADIGVIA